MEILDIKINPEAVFRECQHTIKKSSLLNEFDETISSKDHESQPNTYIINKLRQILYKIELSSAFKANKHEKEYVLERCGGNSR